MHGNYLNTHESRKNLKILVHKSYFNYNQAMYFKLSLETMHSIHICKSSLNFKPHVGVSLTIKSHVYNVEEESGQETKVPRHPTSATCSRLT